MDYGTTMLSFWRYFASLILCAAALAGPTSAPASRPALPSNQEIRRTIGQLNHPSPSKRRAAIRQLAEWGPIAFEELKHAATASNIEVALSARDLLEELKSAILVGAEIRLQLSREQIGWKDPVSLTVIARNSTAGEVRVPWAVPASRPAGAVVSDADQVAAMMDAADFLVVSTPEGLPVTMRVEPIERNSEVYEAVDLRARGTPPSHTIPPGTEARLVIADFNRGWARYPMLEAGPYTISFSYQPQWKEESWTQSGFGMVKAGPVGIEIDPGAPEEILTGSNVFEMHVRREGKMFQAEIVSTWDLPQSINLNLNGPLSTHAKMEWSITPARQDNAEPIELQPMEEGGDFVASELRQIAPAEKKVISRMPVANVEARIREAVGDKPVKFVVRARYVHLSTPDQLRDELRKNGNQAEVPVHLFTGSISSEDVSLDELKP